MPHAEFRNDYNHRWPSGAETAYKAGWSGSVKGEVFDAATKAGALVGSRTPPRGELPRNVPKLKKLAKDEGIDLGDASTADEIIATIEAGRKLAATPPSETSATPGAPAAPITSAPPLSTDTVSQ